MAQGSRAESLYICASAALAPDNSKKRMRRFLRVLTVLLLAATAARSAAASDDAAARSIAVGIDAYRQGSPEASVEALSEALQGRLSSRQAAKAHYYRGLAYRALGKPGQAIADFDAAIAQVNGLSLGRLMEAENNRAAAFREAAGGTGQSAVPAKAGQGPQISGRTPSPQSFLTTTSIDPAEPAPSSWDEATIVPPVPVGEPIPFTTEVLPGGARANATADGIRVQVARVQTQSEAYALVVRLISQHGAEFDPTMLKIERGVADGMTVAYLVRLGPFADADQAQQRCSALRRSGFDCVVQY
jgi:tetratricopeptide (TPR) repeat protein